MAVKIVYHPAAVDVTLTFKRGPVDFRPYWAARVNDNLSTSGAVRERVTANKDILISWQMPHLVVNDDIEQWAAFEGFGLDGGVFKLYPDDGMEDYYNCVLEDQGFEPARNAPRKYGAAVKVRILNDSQAPADPSVVLRRFYGLA